MRKGRWVLASFLSVTGYLLENSNFFKCNVLTTVHVLASQQINFSSLNPENKNLPNTPCTLNV